MSEFWSESMADTVDGVEVCAICGKVHCGPDQDRREQQQVAPARNHDEPAEEIR
jgi:hypothetical protein